MKSAVTFLLIASSLSSQAQRGFFAAGDLSYSTYYMKQMGDYQTTLQLTTPVTLKQVHRFPAWWGNGLSAGYSWSQWGSGAGLTYNYNTTGGRLDNEDYSGFVRIDQLMTSNSIGVFSQFAIVESHTWPVFIGFSTSLVMTKLKLSQQVNVGGQSLSETYIFNSGNRAIRVWFSVRRNFRNAFLHAGLGYEFQDPGKLYLNNSSTIFLNYGGDPITAQWGGMRATVGAGIHFRKNKKQDNE
jgi:hypothetical protein